MKPEWHWNPHIFLFPSNASMKRFLPNGQWNDIKTRIQKICFHILSSGRVFFKYIETKDS